MSEFSSDEIREALRPIASLTSKSEKALLKLAPGSWQHTMLRDNIAALHIASALLSGESDGSDRALAELDEALKAVASMVQRTEDAQRKFAPGTSQHSLQRNRLKSLHVAREALEQAANRSAR